MQGRRWRRNLFSVYSSVIRQANPPLAEVEQVSVCIQALGTYTPELCSESSSKAAEPLSIPWGLGKCARLKSFSKVLLVASGLKFYPFESPHGSRV